MEGDFAYREEGLLDRTHLRFFTRRSIARLMAESGYDVQELQTIDNPLDRSEFRARFDELPPAVARYLQVLPDAQAYQILVRTTAGSGSAAAALASAADSTAALPRFTASLYLRDANGYDEARKVRTAGIVGEARQTMRFEVPAGVTGLRFDPADRPGFLGLHALRLLRDGQAVWEWRQESDGLQALAAGTHQQIAFAGPAAPAGLVLLYGDDPWIELPVPAQQLAVDAPLVFEADLGWPMSADYLALAGAVAGDVAAARAATDAARAAADAAGAQLAEVQRAARLADEQLAWLRSELAREGARATELAVELQAAAERQEHLRSDLRAREAELAQRDEAAVAQDHALAQARHRLAEQNLELRDATREKLVLQRSHAELQQQFEGLAQHLRWIEASTVFRATRPLVHAKMAVDRWLGRASASATATTALPVPETPAQPIAPTVDIIVPVYRNLEETRCCIEAALATQGQSAWRVVVLNDASPEPEVTQWLRELAQREPRVTLLENPENLGFVGTVNRGMALSDSNDVVLLNSDAEVANDWLDRLRAAAYRDARVASVTPFSNHATICSYPKFCEPNPLPEGWTVAQLDRAFAQANPGQVLDVPTGVGFCMYIRRDALRELGLFDVEQFGKGYGEENDFCRRAADAGWRNLHALDTFVRHSGGVSFGESKSQREIEAVEKLRRLHPTYERIVHEYVQADPPRAARLRADVARIGLRGLPVVLAVAHNRGGGTLRHVEELAGHLRDRATFLSLLPVPGHAVRLELLEPGSTFRLEFSLQDQWDDLLATLRSLGVAHVHYHHMIGHDDRVAGLAKQLGVTSDFTTHDYFSHCPNISLTDQDDRYCGEEGRGDCTRCAANAPNGDIAAWRNKHGELLAQSRAVLAPSRDTAARYHRLWPRIALRVAPHTDIADPAKLPAPRPAPIGASAPLRVAVLGGMSRIKGADVLEEVATLAARSGAPVEFHLVGHAYRALHIQPRAALTVHGAYQEPDLPRLLAWLQPHLVWFPAQWPETYSYTLSACLEAGLPVAASDLGAFAERLDGRRWSWVEAWDLPAQAWLDRFVAWRAQHFVPGVAPEPYAWTPPADASALPLWVHAQDYLQGVQAQPVSPLPDRVVRAAAFPPSPPVVSAPGLKRLALSSLVRLRTTPGLRRVANAVPSQLQRRIKNWLVA